MLRYDIATMSVRQLAEFKTEKDPLDDDKKYSFLNNQKSLFSELSNEDDRDDRRKQHEREQHEQSKQRE